MRGHSGDWFVRAKKVWGKSELEIELQLKSFGLRNVWKTTRTQQFLFNLHTIQIKKMHSHDFKNDKEVKSAGYKYYFRCNIPRLLI